MLKAFLNTIKLSTNTITGFNKEYFFISIVFKIGVSIIIALTFLSKIYFSIVKRIYYFFLLVPDL